MNPDSLNKAQSEYYSGKLLEKSDETYEVEDISLRYIEEEKGGALVDLGCGHGDFLLKVKGSWMKTGIDLYPSNNKGFESKVADISHGIPLEKESVDVISAQMIIEHLIDTDHFLDECNRILKENGALVLSTTNLAHPRVWAKLMAGVQPSVVSYSLYDGCRHTRYYTFTSLKEQLARHGFTIEKRHGAIGLRKLTRWMPKKYRIKLFGLLPQLGGEIVIKARKIKK